MSKLKYPALAVFCIFLMALGIGLDVWFEPHRDVRTVPVFDEFDVDDFTHEFIENPQAASDRYLAADGESKIVTMTGVISDIDTNLRGDIVVLLKGKEEAGARFTFSEDQNEKASELKIGESTKITGAVSAGAVYDKDFGRYLDAILEQAYF